MGPMVAGLAVCWALLCCLGRAARSTEGDSALKLRRAARVEEARLEDERISCIVKGEIKGGEGFSSAFLALLDEGEDSLRVWLEKRMRIEIRYNRMMCTCCLSSRSSALERVKLPNGMKVPESPSSNLSMCAEEKRYVEVLLAVLVSQMSGLCSSSTQLSLMLGPGEFPRILGERRFRSGTVRVLEQPAGYKTGLLSERGDRRWWSGRVPLFKVELADREKLEGMGLLMALERSLGRWSEEVERRGAKRNGDSSNPGTSKVSLHLVRKELYRCGYYKLREVPCLEEGSEVTSVLFYNAYWDHRTLLKPLGRWLQGQTAERDRGSFWDVSVESQCVERGNVGDFMSYGEGCVRLYDGWDWMVLLLVDNDGTSSFFPSDESLLEQTLAWC